MIYSVTVKPGSKKGPLVVPTSAPPASSTVSETSPSSAPGPNPETAAELTVYLREKPVEGAANTALVRLLADYFRVPKTSVKIKSGARGRKKLIEIP